MTIIICHTIHFIETCLPNDFGPIFFCWGCIHGKPLYRGILCRSKGYKVYKVASPGKNDFFQGFYLDWPLYRDEDLPWKGSSGWWGSWVRRARARAPKGSQNWSRFGARARAARWGPLPSQGLLSKESVLEALSVGGGGMKWPVQHWFCFTIDSVNDFGIDICLAVGFVRFRSHSKSFGFPIDEIDEYSPKVWTWPLNFIDNHVDAAIDAIKKIIATTTIVV